MDYINLAPNQDIDENGQVFDLGNHLDWPHVGQVFRVERVVWHNRFQGKTRQVVYGLTDLPPQKASPARLLALTRQYWGIENGLHYRRDVTLHEDGTRLTVGQAGRNMAIVNNLVIGLCLDGGQKNLAQAKRKYCAHPDKAIQFICHHLDRKCKCPGSPRDPS
jgi:hypothetical protein